MGNNPAQPPAPRPEGHARRDAPALFEHVDVAVHRLLAQVVFEQVEQFAVSVAAVRQGACQLAASGRDGRMCVIDDHGTDTHARPRRTPFGELRLTVHEVVSIDHADGLAQQVLGAVDVRRDRDAEVGRLGDNLLDEVLVGRH